MEGIEREGVAKSGAERKGEPASAGLSTSMTVASKAWPVTTLSSTT